MSTASSYWRPVYRYKTDRPQPLLVYSSKILVSPVPPDEQLTDRFRAFASVDGNSSFDVFWDMARKAFVTEDHLPKPRPV